MFRKRRTFAEIASTWSSVSPIAPSRSSLSDGHVHCSDLHSSRAAWLTRCNSGSISSLIILSARTSRSILAVTLFLIIVPTPMTPGA
jgi:hypothetical protein